MQKSCKSEGCQRKFDKTSHSDLCPPCSSAYRAAEIQVTKRLEHQQRQQMARAEAQAAQRDINNIDLSSPPPPTTMSMSNLQPNFVPPYSSMPPPMNMLPNSSLPPLYTHTLTQPMMTPAPTQSITPHTTIASSGPPTNNLLNFPQAELSSRSLPNIDVNSLYETFSSMDTGSGSVDSNKAMKDMYGMMLHLFSKSDENDAMKGTVKNCVSRIDALEAKVGNSDEAAIPLSIAVRNLGLPPPGTTDLQLIRSVFTEIRAQGVEVDRDVIKANRLGADSANGRLGTVLVEMRTQEAKAQIMKTKKCLETHHSQGLQKLIIKNAQTKNEIKTNIALNEMLKRIPGQENNFIAGNGHIMSKNNSQNPYQPRNNTQPRTRPAYQPTYQGNLGYRPQQQPFLGRHQFPQNHHYQLPQNNQSQIFPPSSFPQNNQSQIYPPSSLPQNHQSQQHYPTPQHSYAPAAHGFASFAPQYNPDLFTQLTNTPSNQSPQPNTQTHHNSDSHQAEKESDNPTPVVEQPSASQSPGANRNSTHISDTPAQDVPTSQA